MELKQLCFSHLRKDPRLAMPLSTLLTAQTQVVASKAPVVSELAGEAIILDPTSGIYYGLSNDVGIRIWQLIQQATSVSQVQEAILSEYEIDAQQCDRDTTEILQALVNHNLAEVVDV